MTISKPLLPLELIASIAEYLNGPDLIRFARTSRRMLEMIYDDARWIRMLQRMGCWDESEARRRAEGTRPGGTTTGIPGSSQERLVDRSILNGKGRPADDLATNGIHRLTGPKSDSNGHDHTTKASQGTRGEAVDGFDIVNISGTSTNPAPVYNDLAAALTVLKRVKSIRGYARQEYGKVYKALGGFYRDAITASSPLDCLIFQMYSLPDQQAQMLSQIRVFAKSDFSPGCSLREQRLDEMAHIFDTAALLEFRKGYEYKDIQARMKQYANVMYILNGGQSSIELFLHDNRLITQKTSLGSASDCIDYSLGYGQISLERTQLFFDRLASGYGQESVIIDQVFPQGAKVHIAFLNKVGDDVLRPFLTSLFDEAHARGVPTYLRTVSGSFAQTRQFINECAVYPERAVAEEDGITSILSRIFGPHIDLYLAEELATFKQKAESEVGQWEQTLSAQAASTENFLMSNINRQADKKDFLSSFKKVVLMPVNILPGMSSSSSQKTSAKPAANGNVDSLTSNVPSRSSTPLPTVTRFSSVQSKSPAPVEAPTTELAAKAALMTSKLENIRALFSIEVSLNLVHAAKSSLERAAQFIALGNPLGEAARTQCAVIYVQLLQSVGIRHIKAGFDKAIEHLSTYNPRDASAEDGHSETRVAPLATFLELVNVGDLIQQMLDVFYESELVRLGISNRDDFLDPCVKEKKKFEVMLDERVAAGLSKSIDVLMDEVEFVCATTQQPTDFNPVNEEIIDIGTTLTARKVVSLVQSHTSMLTGATEKSLLDVFSAEVGLRLFTSLTKHLKRQRISTVGALPLLADLSHYANFIATFKNPDLNSYFAALRAVGQIYLIDGKQAKEMGTIIADGERYRGVFTVEEVVEFAERRSDWLVGGVKTRVEKAMYGQDCGVM